MEVCRDCEVVLTDKNRGRKDRSICKGCKNLKEKAAYHSDVEGRRIIKKRSQVKQNYGITLEEYEDAMATSNVCQHCGTTKELCYDHDHDKPKDITAFRGVLCRSCNRHLGGLGDTIEDIERILRYLKGE